MSAIALQIDEMAKHKGRPKKDAIKRTFRIDRLNMAMLRIYAEQNAIDMTAALNQMIRKNLTAAGLVQAAQDLIEEEDRMEESDN